MDQNYSTTSTRCAAGSGIQARYIYDAPPAASWLNYDNCESREEGATSSRLGLAAVSTDGATKNFPLGSPVNSLSRMQGLGTPYRYAGTTGGFLYRRAGDTVGAFTQIAAGLSGGRVSMSPYRPANSSMPWQFIADENVLLKDNGIGAPAIFGTGYVSTNATGLIVSLLFGTPFDTSGAWTGLAVTLGGVQFTIAGVSSTTQLNLTSAGPLSAFDIAYAVTGIGANNWGIQPPLQPALVLPVVPGLVDIELFDEATDASFVLANLGSAAMVGRVQFNGLASGPITATGPQVVIPSPQNYGAGSAVRASGVTTVNAPLHGFVSGMRVMVTVNNTADNSFVVASTVITVIDANHFSYQQPGLANQTSASSLIQFNPMPSLEVGMSISTTDANAETVYITEIIGPSTLFGLPAFVASFTMTHTSGVQFKGNYLSGSVAANTTATITKPDVLNLSFPLAQVAADQNYVQVYLLLSNPLAVSQISVMFDVGDGTFTQDYYSKSAVMSVAQPLASGSVSAAVVQSQAVAGRAIGTINVSTLGGGNPSLLPSDYPLLGQLQPTSLDPGMNVWTLIQIPLAQFVANGAAGGPNNNWANVIAWRVQVQTNPTMTTTIGIDDLAFVGGSDLNSFAGQPYDYRYTYLNLNTGCESNPSMTMVGTNALLFPEFENLGAVPVPLSVQQQGIQVNALASPDPQVTHWNLYRRGGSLTQAWYFVAQIPIVTLTYVDTIADGTIEINNQLLVDSDAPVTSLLPTPLNTTIFLAPQHSINAGPGLVTVKLSSGTVKVGQTVTIGTGSTLEQCYVQAILGNNVTLYLQLNYNTTSAFFPVSLTATASPQTPMNLSAIAFDQAFLAGDPNNPHVLYFSRTFGPETFPSENFIEVGTPDSPIMALVVLRGILWVLTTKTIWQIYGGQGAAPVAVPTGVMHGLVANFAWAASENVIYYLSYDGVYMFTGSASTYLTQNTEWIWTSRTETNGVIPVLNQEQKSNVFMAYGNHELFAAYIDQSGVTHRQIASDSYNRWRNDDQLTGNVTAMFFEQDTGQMLVGKDDGMVYIDQINDYDSGGWGPGGEIKNPIAINLQSPQLDLGVPKNYKNFNELTLDCTLPTGLVINVNAIFDSLATVKSLGTIIGTGSRTQYQVNIVGGLGYRSLNMGLNLTGSTTGQAVFHEIHIRSVLEAEERMSYDSYLLDFGSASFKLAKQGWFVFSAPDPNGIVMRIYVDGAVTPIYQFTLPQSVNRATQKVRFPALKFRIIRFVGMSNSPFQMYTKDTECEFKLLDAQKGYAKMALST